MEQSETPEGLIRRTIIKDDGRLLNFYNPPGEEQPIDADVEQGQAGSPASAGGGDAHV